MGHLLSKGNQIASKRKWRRTFDALLSCFVNVLERRYTNIRFSFFLLLLFLFHCASLCNLVPFHSQKLSDEHDLFVFNDDSGPIAASRFLCVLTYRVCIKSKIEPKDCLLGASARDVRVQMQIRHLLLIALHFRVRFHFDFH